MKYKIDKKLLLEDIEGLEGVEIPAEPTEDELAAQEAKDAEARRRFAIGMGLLGANAAGVGYAINKQKVDKAVGDYASAKKESVKQSAADFGAGAKKGYQHPGRFQKNDRSQSEVMGHKLGQGTIRLQKKMVRPIKDKLNMYRKKFKGML